MSIQIVKSGHGLCDRICNVNSGMNVGLALSVAFGAGSPKGRAKTFPGIFIRPWFDGV